MIWAWIGFSILVLTLLAVDLGVLNRKAHRIGLREAAGWTTVWIVLGLAFTIFVYFLYERRWFGIVPATTGYGIATNGAEAAMLYLTGYLLEKSLSMDNLFVMALIFRSFGVRAEYQHRVLYWGILGAIVTRSAMVFGGVWLFLKFSWLFYVFGAYLVYAGIRILKQDEQEEVSGDSRLVRALRRVLPIATGDHGANFVTRQNGRFAFTVLFLVVVVIELTDVVFAVDSVPAVLAITSDSFIVLTSNIFAILGLRSLYFVLAEMIQRFAYLNYALSAILVFIGAKMLLHSLIQIPTGLSLAFIALLFIVGVVASVRKVRETMLSRSSLPRDGD